MIIVPDRFGDILSRIIEWHLETYCPSLDDIILKRILECFYEKNKIEGHVQIEKRYSRYLFDCVADAVSFPANCGVEKELIWEIYSWIAEERKKV